MPALLKVTETALGGDTLPHCQSRLLRLTRYARPDLREENRKNFLAAVTNGQRESAPATATLAWQHTLPGSRQLHARLEARLLLNMAGSVLENAGLGLDRYGLVPIPGSALKGCARRTALATLRQWCALGEKPGSDDILTSAAAPFASPADLLLAILRVCGCTDLEWEDYDDEKNKGNDLAWACTGQWETLRDEVRVKLNAETKSSDDPAPSRRGSVAFLPAYPAKIMTQDLELDVLTPHHKEYYSSDDPAAVALDNEDPVPVLFPAVAAGAEYTFTLVPLSSATPALLDYAETWLRTGLTTFGLGAKTAAGYGWFEDVTTEICERNAHEIEKRRAVEAQAAEEKRHAEELAARKFREAELANMSPDQRADLELAERVSDKGHLKEHLARFADKKKPLTVPEKTAVLRWFAAQGPGRDLWLNEIKPGQGKPKDAKVWKRIIGDINITKKALKINLP